MDHDPHAVIEGMVIAGYATGASRGFVYLRYEYPETLGILERAIDEARAAGLVGESALTFATSGGEDYELLFGMRPSDYELLDSETFHVLGVFTEDQDGVRLQLRDGSHQILADAGFKHFETNGSG